MNGTEDHSFAAYVAVMGLRVFIICGFFVLLLNIKTFYRWSVELLRPLVGWVLILVGVAIRDTFYLVESVAQKGKRIGSKVNFIGLNINYDHRQGGAF